MKRGAGEGELRDISLEVGARLWIALNAIFKESNLNGQWEAIEGFWLGGDKLELRVGVIMAFSKRKLNPKF